MSKKKIIIIVAVLAVIALTLFTVWGNTTVETERFTLTSDRLPDSFDGFRIAHISDLHNAEFGENNSILLDILRRESPDMIAITGDFIDSRKVDTRVALDLIKEAVGIAPCYYVTGNHEERLHGIYEDFLKDLEDLGVTVLENETVTITRGDDSITVAGVKDPLNADRTELNNVGIPGVIDHVLDRLDGDIGENYTILLSHRPEAFKAYTAHGVDLALCGHVHGGQIRLPLIGGIYGPGQGLFPKYDAGLYSENGTNMIISRGIGNSAFPVRFNDRPEIVIVELKKK